MERSRMCHEHGPVVARIEVRADGTAVMRIELELPRMDVKDTILKALETRPVKRPAVHLQSV